MKKRIALFVLAIAMSIIACGGDPKGGSDLSDPKFDMYFECTARQRDGGYGVVEAGARCQALWPKGE